MEAREREPERYRSELLKRARESISVSFNTSITYITYIRISFDTPDCLVHGAPKELPHPQAEMALEPIELSPRCLVTCSTRRGGVVGRCGFGQGACGPPDPPACLRIPQTHWPVCGFPAF